MTLGFFIGRCQLPHLGHVDLLRAALSKCSRLLVLIGSVYQPRTLKNPFTYEERVEMLQGCFTESELEKITFVPLPDLLPDPVWVRSVDNIVSKYGPPSAPTTIFGYEKDESSYYLQLFSHYRDGTVAESYHGLSSTPLRTAYFKEGRINTEALHSHVVQYLERFSQTEHYKTLQTLSLEDS